MSRGAVFLYVQHLLGIGHLKRALLIAQSIAAAGHTVTVASGGNEVPLLDRSGLNWVQLAPASAADLGFRQLLDGHGRPVDDQWREERRAQLLQAWKNSDADLLLIELFPFGRRQMRFELLPLLDEARSAVRPPLIVSSIRDVLGGGQGDPQRQLKMLQMFDEHFDHVLVHGDPALIGLDKTFGPVAQLASRMTYTGYVVEQPATLASATGLGKDEVLVSAGGGAVGLPLLEAALAARPMSQLSDRRWRILAGDNLAEAQFRRLQDLADQFGEFRVLVERARPEFPAMLAHCAVSVSQGGYNTVLEVLSQGARAVVVPFAGGGEIEQSMRAHLLHEKGWIQCVDESEMTPRTLAAAVDRAWQSPRPACQIRLDGARQTAQWVTARLAQRGLSGDGQ